MNIPMMEIDLIGVLNVQRCKSFYNYYFKCQMKINQ